MAPATEAWYALPHTGIITLSAVLLWLVVGLGSYSGKSDAPTYGDYEAQRHWMELTLNLPVNNWYTDSKVNNGTYWPLDYPPLSGYQSWLGGLILQSVEPASVALISSHGYESYSSKLAMRVTVLLSHLLVFVPAALAFVSVFYRDRTPAVRQYCLVAILFNPALVLIDHGHFQYNCISLGFAMAAAAAIVAANDHRRQHTHSSGHSRWQLLASVLFSLSLNHKQMSLFFAPAFFAHLLGWALCWKGLVGQVARVAQLGVAVLATFAVLWAPYLTSVSAVSKVLGRIFPLRRGLYEDYVSNFWCATSVVIKWKQVLRSALPAGICTLAAALPAMVQQLCWPSARGLVYCMANTAFAFYMFAYQVHEKSILLPLLPITMLAGDHPLLAALLPLVASASMYPLLERDGLALQYLAACLLYLVVMWPFSMQLLGNDELIHADNTAASTTPGARRVSSLMTTMLGSIHRVCQWELASGRHRSKKKTA